MMADDQLDLAYRLLDLDLVDSEGVRCGKVDDLEIEGEPGEAAYVSAVLHGGATLGDRLPRRIRKLGARVFRGKVRRVEWSQVSNFDATVELDGRAEDLDLGRGDRAAASLISWIPGADR